MHEGPRKGATMIAYHWLKDDMSAGRGNEKPWSVGEERTYKGRRPIKLCERGYHSSPTLFDALQYAPGNVACLVEVSEPITKDETKSASKTRKLLAAVNVERELRQFAIDCAERILLAERDNGREPDVRSWAAIEAARAYLRGEITPEELSAAYYAAYSAASYAASSAEQAWQRARFDEAVLPRLESAARFSEAVS